MNWPEIKRRWEDRMWNFGQGQTTEPHTHFLVIQQFLQPRPYPFSYSSLPTPLITQTSPSICKIISFINTILPLSPF